MVGLTSPDKIDGSFVARAVDDATEVLVGSEVVVVGGFSQATVLNPTGALIWHCIDGSSTLDELITDLSEELSVERGVVETDVLGFARQLGEAGLLEGVGWSPTDADRAHLDMPDVGDELDDFTLADLDGVEGSLSDYRGSDVLIVNWSATCGFCTMIAERIAKLHPLLEERAMELLFVAHGDAESNRAALDGAAIRARMFLLDDDTRPFGSVGTPAALLLDADGRVAAPMAVGANEVPALLAELAGVENEPIPPPVVDEQPSDASVELVDPVPPGTRYLPAPGGT